MRGPALRLHGRATTPDFRASERRRKAAGARPALNRGVAFSRRTNQEVLLNSCAGNIAIHIAIRAQENNNMTGGISTIPFQLVGRNYNARANRNMRAA
jgi:hypothetical protein